MGIFEQLLTDFGAIALIGSLAVALIAGVIKGTVGFAMPMITVSGIGSFMSAEVAIAALILPTFATNIMQAMRGGGGPAIGAFMRFWKFNAVLVVMILFTAQLVAVMPQRALFLALGLPVVVFGLVQLVGWHPSITRTFRTAAEIAAALVAGFFGGLAGVWGPPLVMLLMALDVPKPEAIRVQGVTYLIGSAVLILAHLQSGILDVKTLPYSAVLIVPAAIGVLVGFQLQDRMDQQVFRRLTLIVLILAGLNLMRRGLLG